MSLKVMTHGDSAEAKMLAAFATDMIGTELARLGLTAEIVRDTERDGYEFVCSFNYSGRVYIDADGLRDAPAERLVEMSRQLRQIIDAVRVGIGERMAL